MEDDPRRDLRFIVVFKPKASWADDTYFGNLLVEVLGQVANMTEAFEFEVLKAEGEGEGGGR